MNTMKTSLFSTMSALGASILTISPNTEDVVNEKPENFNWRLWRWQQTKKPLKIVVLILSMIYLSVLRIEAQNKFPNTIFSSDSTISPSATLDAIRWVEGHWRGEALGGITEEIWTPPLGGSMMCAFKLVVKDKVSFYELVTIVEYENTLILRLKHFHSDLKGWEEKDKTIDFRLVKITDNMVFFDGFTFEKVSSNEINMYVVIENNGNQVETKFNYKRVK
jgi:hypothetical protein